MNIILNHVEKHLKDLLESCDDDTFENVFSRLKSENKSELKNVLRYLFIVIEKSVSQENKLKTLHIHFEKIFDDHSKTLISEFLWHYYFYKSHLNEYLSVADDNPVLQKKIESLEKEINNGTSYPYEDPLASKAEKKRIKDKIRKLRESFKISKKHLNYYKSLHRSASLVPETLINLKVNQLKNLNTHFNYNPTYLSADENELSDLNSYVLYNTNGFNEIKTLQINNLHLLRLIKNIVLFDCDNSLQRFSGFNYAQLSNLNKNHGTKFISYLVITFAKKESFVSIKSKIDELKERYYLPSFSSYIITNNEFDYLIKRQTNYKPKINFIGPINSVFWDDFNLKVKINGLYELRSFKMMNIYSLCFNQEIKDYILNNIFSNNIDNSLVTKDTYEDIFSLPEEDIINLKYLLSNVLDIIINANLLYEIDNCLINGLKIILDDFIIKNKDFIFLIKKSIKVRFSKTFTTWDELESTSDDDFLILSYRDQGNYNHHFYPNINEIRVSETSSINGLFCAFFFKKQFDWSTYNLAKNYYSIHNHSIRINHFEWNVIKGKLDSLKPEKAIDTSWDLENDYSNSDSRVTYKIVFKDKRHSTCNPSDLLIYSEFQIGKKRIQPIRWIYEHFEYEESALITQNLHDLIDEFNPAEKLVDTEQQENDLEIIRNQFDLSGESAGRLWKILLERKAINTSVDKIYNDLKSKFTSFNIDLVSKNHFEKTWLNPESYSLMPRGNRAFKVLCDYLELPTIYLRIMYTIKNRNINGARNANRIYSRLLKDLFNDGCFDDGINPLEILSPKMSEYEENHNFDELGLDTTYPLKDLITLIDLIKPELNFKEIHSIERRQE